jgi:hypothetical protein
MAIVKSTVDPVPPNIEAVCTLFWSTPKARSRGLPKACWAAFAGLLWGLNDSSAQTAPPVAGTTPASPSPAPAASEYRTHTIGPRYDYGSKSHGAGVGYLYLVGFPPQQPFFWGIGGDARIFVEKGGAVVAGSASGVARVTAGHAPPMTLEISAGGLFSSEHAGGVASAGGFLSLFYADFGYSYQFPFLPFERPSWLSSHQFSLRLHIPLLTH